jgi:hypothetical protein
MQFGTELQLLILVDAVTHCAKAQLGSYDYLGTGTSTTISTTWVLRQPTTALRTQLFSYS